MLPEIFLDNKKRNLILWLTDMTVAIASYFYITNPFYIQNILNGIDFATLRPDVDPAIFQSPVFVEFMYTVVNIIAPVTIGLIAFVHTLAFYKCYLRKRTAIAYVKIYSVLAAVSLVMWFIYNISVVHVFILVPAAIYAWVFMAEHQPLSTQTVDNVLTNKNNNV